MMLLTDMLESLNYAQTIQIAMWIKKTINEIVADRKSRRLREFHFAILLWILLSILTAAALHKCVPAMDMGSPLQSSLFVDLVSMIMTGCSVTVWYWVRLMRTNSGAALVCRKCNVLKGSDGKSHCDCGGEFVNLEDMKWQCNLSLTAQPENPPRAEIGIFGRASGPQVSARG
jgi:hypothetical protein